LTCDFAEVFEDLKSKTAIIRALRLRFHWGLRQSGGAFGAAFYGTRERVPFPGSSRSALPGSSRSTLRSRIKHRKPGLVVSDERLGVETTHFVRGGLRRFRGGLVAF